MNVEFDDRLVEEARKLGGQRSRKAAVHAALEQYIERRKQTEILRLFGTIAFHSGWDVKGREDVNVHETVVDKSAGGVTLPAGTR